MKVTYTIQVPVYVTVDFDSDEQHVTYVTVDDSNPVGGWDNVQDIVEFHDSRVFKESDVNVQDMTGGQRLALKKALELANNNEEFWPGWEFG